MSSRRLERINQDLVRRVSAAIRQLKDPRIGFITVTKAAISADLRRAKIFVSIFEEGEKQEACFHAVQHSARFIRQSVAQHWTMKVVPHLDFYLDRECEIADRMSRLIAQARASDPHPPSLVTPLDTDPEEEEDLFASDDENDEEDPDFDHEA